MVSDVERVAMVSDSDIEPRLVPSVNGYGGAEPTRER